LIVNGYAFNFREGDVGAALREIAEKPSSSTLLLGGKI